MKKLLSLAFCAAATAAFAADEITLADEVGVTMVTLPAGQTNTIIAVSFTDFDTGNVSISNLVKTTSLAAGDEILLYTAKDTYSAWKLDANKVWQKAVKTYTVDGNGVATESVGDDRRSGDDDRDSRHGSLDCPQKSDDGGVNRDLRQVYGGAHVVLDSGCVESCRQCGAGELHLHDGRGGRSPD